MYWFINIFDYTTNTTFYSLFIPMNNKHLITWLVIVWVITAVWLFVSFVSNADAKKELSDQEICYGTWSTFDLQVKACWRIIKQAQENYEKLQKELQKNANIASGTRLVISKVAQEFYDNNLSGTNVNFITTK